eukprot:TRINITY_DN12078_c0_g1_i2.p1 TRINITY_DN12078_c0_g1~~TRINITY_DN12078_c0_g1_i2.p1  ORF type:complete len:278 (-),score=74.45 TRINITY_DN12078_c0_g1_i2:16-849(-)
MALGEAGAREAAALLASKDPIVQRAAVIALGRLGERSPQATQQAPGQRQGPSDRTVALGRAASPATRSAAGRGAGSRGLGAAGRGAAVVGAGRKGRGRGRGGLRRSSSGSGGGAATQDVAPSRQEADPVRSLVTLLSASSTGGGAADGDGAAADAGGSALPQQAALHKLALLGERGACEVAAATAGHGDRQRALLAGAMGDELVAAARRNPAAKEHAELSLQRYWRPLEAPGAGIKFEAEPASSAPRGGARNGARSTTSAAQFAPGARPRPAVTRTR